MNEGVIKFSGINLYQVYSCDEHEIPSREYLKVKLQMNASKVT
jgi:hypothetical protein